MSLCDVVEGRKAKHDGPSEKCWRRRGPFFSIWMSVRAQPKKSVTFRPARLLFCRVICRALAAGDCVQLVTASGMVETPKFG